MSGKTYTCTEETGEETEFKCLTIGHFFHRSDYTDKLGNHSYPHAVCVKTGKATYFNLRDQEAKRISLTHAVKRVHAFEATQTIED